MIKNLKRVLNSIRERVKLFLKTYVRRDELFLSRRNFKIDDAAKELRYNYPLTSQSVVLDLGGYKGEWANKISDMYDSYIYIFEPVKPFSDLIEEKFTNNSKIRTFNFGLSDFDGEELISLNNDSSSVFGGNKDIKIAMRDLVTAINEIGIKRIDLMKINIEGGEFKVLPRLIESGLIKICSDIQVQFHHFYPDAEKLRNEIRNQLVKTHHITYDYPFAFENWRKNI